MGVDYYVAKTKTNGLLLCIDIIQVKRIMNEFDHYHILRLMCSLCASLLLVQSPIRMYRKRYYIQYEVLCILNELQCM